MTRGALDQAEARPPQWLVRLNRRTLSAVLVVGGSPEQRAGIAHKFHTESPLRGGPILTLDCASEEPRLREALAAWLAQDPDPGANPLRAASHGTLFLDSIAALSLESQQRLLAVIREWTRSGEEGVRGVGRLIVGSGEDPARAVAQHRLLPELLDFADKIRVVLQSRASRDACVRDREAVRRGAGVTGWGRHFAAPRAGGNHGERHGTRD